MGLEEVGEGETGPRNDKDDSGSQRVQCRDGVLGSGTTLVESVRGLTTANGGGGCVGESFSDGRKPRSEREGKETLRRVDERRQRDLRTISERPREILERS